MIRIGTGPLFNTSDEVINKLTMEEKAFGDYTPGRFAWILHDPITFKIPMGAKGSLTLWEFDEGLTEQNFD